MNVKEARKLAGLTKEEVLKKYGIAEEELAVIEQDNSPAPEWIRDMLVREFLREANSPAGNYLLIRTTRHMIVDGDNDLVLETIKYFTKDDATTALSHLSGKESVMTADTGNSFTDWSLWECDSDWNQKQLIKRIVRNKPM